MTIEAISSGAGPHRNDDHIAVFNHAGFTDILVFDGATSVAEQDYIDPVVGDAAWFVQAFAAALEEVLTPALSQQDCVQAASAIVRSSYEQMTVANPAPMYAWPVAAMTWLRIGRQHGASAASLYCLGDCKSLLWTPGGGCVDLDPFINPQEAIVQAEIATLRAQGIGSAAERRAHLLPMLRARREAQNTASAPDILCLQPHGPFAPRMRQVDLAPDASVLVMTDGFYRLVDTYALYTDETLFDACLQRGLAAMLDALRTHEAHAGGAGLAVKAADDASAAIWCA